MGGAHETLLEIDNNSSGFTRAVTGISLWRTVGKISDWTQLDRIEFPSVKEERCGGPATFVLGKILNS